jgi:hypothetical protein
LTHNDGRQARHAQEERDREGTGLLPQQRAPDALPLVPLTRPARRLGVVEASRKTVAGQRLKQAGMHWTVGGADAIIALRCQQAGSTWEQASRDIPRPQAHTA